jgi:hypothetical protein
VESLSKQTKQRLWLLVVGTATLIIGASYTTAQVSTRQAANDQPIKEAQSTSSELAAGTTPANAVPPAKINLRSDSNVFVIITDSFGHVLASSASLDGQTPLPPSGVFSYASNHSSNKFTWQPAGGVRLATEVMSYGKGDNSGFIITGQSLAAVESRINTYGAIALAAWVGVLAWSSALIWLPLTPKAKRGKRRK